MEYVIYYKTINLTPIEIRQGVEYLNNRHYKDLFHATKKFNGIIVSPRKDNTVGTLEFPPTKEPDDVSYIIVRDKGDLEGKEIKIMLSGLEKVLKGKFAAIDNLGHWSIGPVNL